MYVLALLVLGRIRLSTARGGAGPALVVKAVPSNRRSHWSISRREQGEGTDLLEESEQVRLGPLFGDLAVVDAVDVRPGDGDGLAGGRQAKQAAGVGAAEDVPDDEAVVLPEGVGEGDVDVGQRGQDQVAIAFDAVSVYGPSGWRGVWH